MKSNINLNMIIELIREFRGIPTSEIINAETTLEDDLGITGDDGVELIDFIQNEAGISFVGPDGTLRDAFNLEEDEYLFNSEGFSLNFYDKKEKVKDISVHDLLLALNKVIPNN